jgi:hypothetical protein
MESGRVILHFGIWRGVGDVQVPADTENLGNFENCKLSYWKGGPSSLQSTKSEGFTGGSIEEPSSCRTFRKVSKFPPSDTPRLKTSMFVFFNFINELKVEDDSFWDAAPCNLHQ